MNAAGTAVSLCAPMVFSKLGVISTRDEIINQAQRRLAQGGFPEARRVYLGTESCEYMLTGNGVLLNRTAKELATAGYAVTFVLPPVGQKKWDAVCALVWQIVGLGVADELVCNDIGILSWAVDHRLPIKLRVGHHFDKMLREARFSLENNPEIAQNSELFSSPYLAQTREKQLLMDMGVVGAEIDPVPGFCIRLPDDWQYAMWYPRTILSYCTSCEFAGLERPVSERFIPGNCKMECLHYQIDVHGDSMQKIVKSGRLVETVSPLPLHELCEGCGRVVWQCDAEDRKAGKQ